MLYVTHDQTEALTLADRIVCMSMGYVQQVGTPLELYDEPANVFVASFIGLPPMNFFDATVSDDGKALSLDGGMTVSLTEAEQSRLEGYRGKIITLGVRPENVEKGGDGEIDVHNSENLGYTTLVHGTLGGRRITAKFREWATYKRGETVGITFGKKHFFDKETTNAIK